MGKIDEDVSLKAVDVVKPATALYAVANILPAYAAIAFVT